MQKADGYITSEAVQTSNRIYSKPYIAGVSVSLLEIEKNKREVSQIVKTRQENNKNNSPKCLRSSSESKGVVASLFNGHREQIKHDGEVFEVFDAFFLVNLH